MQNNIWRAWSAVKRRVLMRCSLKCQSRLSRSLTGRWPLTLALVPLLMRSSNMNFSLNAEGKSSSSLGSQSWWSSRWVRRTWLWRTWSWASRKNWLSTIPRNDDLYLIIIKSHGKVKISTIKDWPLLSRMGLAMAQTIPFRSFWFLKFFAFALILASVFRGRWSIRTSWSSLENYSIWEADRSCWECCSFLLQDFYQGTEDCCDDFFLIFQASPRVRNWSCIIQDR